MPIGTLDKLCTVLMAQMNQWRTRNILAIFIIFNPWISTQNNKLSQSCMNNIEHCDVSTRMQHFQKKGLMIDMQPFNGGGIP